MNRIDRPMTQIRSICCTVDQLTVYHGAAAQSRANREVRKVRTAARGAEEIFTQRASVGVLLNPDRAGRFQTRLQTGNERHDLPAQINRIADDAAAQINLSRTAQAHTIDWAASFCQQRFNLFDNAIRDGVEACHRARGGLSRCDYVPAALN